LLSLLNHTGQGAVSLYLSPDPLGVSYNLGPTWALDCSSPSPPWIPWLPGGGAAVAGPLYAFARCTPSSPDLSCGTNLCGCAPRSRPFQKKRRSLNPTNPKPG